MQPAEFFPKVTPPSLKAADAAREFQLTLTKPTGSLARLEDLGVWLASCQDQVPPKKLTQPRMVICDCQRVRHWDSGGGHFPRPR